MLLHKVTPSQAVLGLDSTEGVETSLNHIIIVHQSV